MDPFVSEPEAPSGCRHRLAACDSLVRLSLALTSFCAILYLILSPVVVTAISATAGLSQSDAGLALGFNSYGATVGGVIAVLSVPGPRWRFRVGALLAALILLDLLSSGASGFRSIAGLRFAHGVCSGALAGATYSIIARRPQRQRAFALIIFLQSMLGGGLTLLLTEDAANDGFRVVWLTLAGFTGLALLLHAVLPSTAAPKTRTPRYAGRAAASSLIIASLAALFLYQAGQIAVFSYLIEIGLDHGLDLDVVSWAAAGSLWIGGPASLLAYWWSTRTGRLLPLVSGTLLMALSFALLFLPDSTAFLSGTLGYGFFYSISFPYLLALAAELDSTGRAAALASLCCTLGEGTGPALASRLLGSGSFDGLLWLALSALACATILGAFSARSLDRRSTLVDQLP